MKTTSRGIPVWPTIVLVVLTGLAACSRQDAALVASGAWVRTPPPGADSLAAYLVLRNGSSKPVTLTGVGSADFDRALIHRTVTANGIARMEHVSSLVIPAHGAVRLEPGGLHLMLLGPRRPLASGDEVELRLLFAAPTPELLLRAPLRVSPP